MGDGWLSPVPRRRALCRAPTLAGCLPGCCWIMLCYDPGVVTIIASYGISRSCSNNTITNVSSSSSSIAAAASHRATDRCMTRSATASHTAY